MACLRLVAFRLRQVIIGISSKSNLVSTLKTTNAETSRKKLPHNWTKAALFSGLLTWLGLQKEDEDPMITTMKRGVLCHQRGEYNKAETILHLALKVAQERQDKQAQNYIFDLLANIAFDKGDLPKAEKLFIEVTRELLSTGISTDDNKIIAISLKLASIYHQQTDYNKAEQGYIFCIFALEKKMQNVDLNNVEEMSDLDKDTALLYGMCMEFYGKHLLERKMFKLAEGNLLKALSISEIINGPAHIQTLILMNDVGTMKSSKKDYEDAILSFKKAISLADKDEKITPVFYCNLGLTYLLQKNIENASKACTKALELAKQTDSSETEKEAKLCLKAIQEARKENAKQEKIIA